VLRLLLLKHGEESFASQPVLLLALCPAKHGSFSGESRVASPRFLRHRGFSHTYHCNCRREMTLCTAVFGLSLRERERRWSITNASAIMPSTVSVVVEHRSVKLGRASTMCRYHQNRIALAPLSEWSISHVLGHHSTLQASIKRFGKGRRTDKQARTRRSHLGQHPHIFKASHRRFVEALVKIGDYG
jgi:hypothetical protein